VRVSAFEFTGSRPKYLQVADDYRMRIRTGDLKVGDSLGDLFKAAHYYSCSWGTVRAAQRMLVAEGLLSPIRAGMPTRVIAIPPSDTANDLLVKLHALRRAVDDLIDEVTASAA